MPEEKEEVGKNDLPEPAKGAGQLGVAGLTETPEASQKGDQEQTAILTAGIDDVRDGAIKRLRDSLQPEAGLQNSLRPEGSMQASLQPMKSLHAPLHPEKGLKTLIGDIYNPEVLKNLREKFAGKRVVVVDLDGVIRGYSNREAPNDGAIEAIRNLKLQGCELVLWTLAMVLDQSLFERCGITYAFSLVIRKKNFDPMFCNTGDAIKSIYEIPWLTEEERAILSAEYLDSDCTKPIPLLFRRCTIVEDSVSSLPHLLKSPDRYRYVYTPTFYGVQKETYSPDRWFGTKHVAEIMDGPINI